MPMPGVGHFRPGRGQQLDCLISICGVAIGKHDLFEPGLSPSHHPGSS